MTRIEIQPADPVKVVQDRLEPLVRALEDEGFEVVYKERPRTGYGVTWWEVFHFFIDETGRDALDFAVLVVIGCFVKWARRRMRDPKGGRARAPKSATIYGPDDRPIKNVAVTAPHRRPKITDLEINDQQSTMRRARRTFAGFSPHRAVASRSERERTALNRAEK
jgi:hypothetical protein